MYVCMVQNYRYVCLSGETYIPRNYRNVYMYVKGMYVCLGKHTYLENKVIGMYVCLGKHTYLETIGMYICMLKVCMCVWGNIHI